MNLAVKQLKPESHYIQADGTVMAREAGTIRVLTRQGELLARRAVSCLVEPMAGDRVFVAGDLNDELFVIAVLEREEASVIRVTIDGDLSIGLPNGRFSVAASKGIDLVSTEDVGLTASELTLRAPRGQIFFDQLSYLGRRIFAQMESLKLVGGFIDAILERISQKVKRSYRMVEEIDLVRSEQIDYRAEKNLSLRGQNALVTAKELVKIDGDQIHLG